MTRGYPMAETMKLLHILAPGEVEWRDAPIPQPGAGEVLIKVAAVTTCPHCFNTLKNDYPELGLRLDVLHHTTYINQLIKAGRLQVKEQKRDEVTFHDSCYLGRANGIYEDPREVLNHFQISIKEMNRAKATGLCCGAGGGQMFKEDEPGTKRINNERIEEAMSTGVKKIITNCPFCLTMMTDGVKAKDKQAEVMVYDLSEMIIQ